MPSIWARHQGFELMAHISKSDLLTALPDVSSNQKFSQIRSRVVINRDKWGIPHIKSDNEYDLFFAQGFATAQDRLFQMDFDRLRAFGRASEYVGYSMLNQDILMRRRGLERTAKLDYEVSSTFSKNAIDAYSDGVNTFLETTQSLPVEYKLLGLTPEPWEPWHSVMVYKVRNTAEGSFQGKLWLSRLVNEIGHIDASNLTKGYQSGQLLTVPPDMRYSGPLMHALDDLESVIKDTKILGEIDAGSNGWVVSGTCTKSGLPVLAGDSHRGLEVPNVYYQIHLSTAGLEILGYSIPGMPMVLHFCHNQYVCWGMTHGGIDTQDLFIEQFKLDDGALKYLFKNEWKSANIDDELIRIAEGTPKSIDVIKTHHGPIIAGDPYQGIGISLADPGAMEGTYWIDAAYKAMKSKSSFDLQEALKGWTDRVNNYPYADVNGNFGYMLSGRVPKRDERNGFGPVAGWTGENEWDGYISINELPNIHNPERGWIVTCNQRLVDENYPYYLTNFPNPGYRAERIVLRIKELEDKEIIPLDMLKIHGDVFSIPANSILKNIERIESFKLKGVTKKALNVLLNWNQELTVNSPAAAIYEVMSIEINNRIILSSYRNMSRDLMSNEESGAEYHWRAHLRPAFIASLQNDESDYDDLILASLKAAVARLVKTFGTEVSTWRWGNLHKTGYKHPLNDRFPEYTKMITPPDVETPGDSDTPFASGMKFGSFITTSGPVNRYFHDPSNWANGRWIVPLGASGHPGSKHFYDQQNMWVKAETIPQLWNWDDITSSAESTQILSVL